MLDSRTTIDMQVVRKAINKRFYEWYHPSKSLLDFRRLYGARWGRVIDSTNVEFSVFK